MILRLVVASLLIIAGLNTHASAQQMPTPSKEHKVLMRDVGDWSIEGRVLTEDGFQKFKGEEKVAAIGEFWTVSHLTSDMLGGLKGSSTMGFDPEAKAFVGTWVDSFQPVATRMKGTYDDKSNTMTFKTTSIGMDGTPMSGKIVILYQDENSHTFTMMHQDPTGESNNMVMTMEVTYTRIRSRRPEK